MRVFLTTAAVILPVAAFADVPLVVTDIPPVHALVAQVMGDLGAPQLLLAEGADLHDFALRPTQMRAVQGADLVIWMGGELTPWLARAMDSTGTTDRGLSLLAHERTFLRPFGDEGAHDHGPAKDHPAPAQDDHAGQAEPAGEKHGDHADQDGDHSHASGTDDDHHPAGDGHDHGADDGHAHGADKGHEHDAGDGHDHGADDGHAHGADDGHDHDADEGHAHGAGDGHDHGADDGHNHGPVDLHAWLDPANALTWLDAIAAALGAKDPANAATYLANAEAAKARVSALDLQIQSELAGASMRPFVVGHDAYGYFTGHYGLANVGAISLSDATSPGAARLTALRARLAEDGVVCVFPEVGQDPGLLATVIEGSQVKVGGALDPEGRGLTPGPELYAQMMTGLAATLKDCLQP